MALAFLLQKERKKNKTLCLIPLHLIDHRTLFFLFFFFRGHNLRFPPLIAVQLVFVLARRELDWVRLCVCVCACLCMFRSLGESLGTLVSERLGV